MLFTLGFRFKAYLRILPTWFGATGVQSWRKEKKSCTCLWNTLYAVWKDKTFIYSIIFFYVIVWNPWHSWRAEICNFCKIKYQIFSVFFQVNLSTTCWIGHNSWGIRTGFLVNLPLLDQIESALDKSFFFTWDVSPKYTLWINDFSKMIQVSTMHRLRADSARRPHVGCHKRGSSYLQTRGQNYLCIHG